MRAIVFMRHAMNEIKIENYMLFNSLKEFLLIKELMRACTEIFSSLFLTSTAGCENVN